MMELDKKNNKSKSRSSNTIRITTLQFCRFVILIFQDGDARYAKLSHKHITEKQFLFIKSSCASDRVKQNFDWERKLKKMPDFYKDAKMKTCKIIKTSHLKMILIH